MTPRRPTGSDPEATYAQRVWDAAFGSSQRIRNSSTVSANYTKDGVFLNVRIPNVKPAGAPSSSDWYTLIQPFGTYTVCSDSSGAIVRIAKPFELWNTIATQKIYGQQINYTYPNDNAPPNPANPLSYCSRFALPSPNPNNVAASLYVITPPYICGGTNGTPASKIKADTLKTALGLTIDAHDTYGGAFSVTMMENSARAWSYAANQSL